jgi:ABC-type multidrug transport system ATPase subunit
MNKLINHYLQILDFFVSFNLDENFTETIRSRHRDDFSYSSFSEGEKSRINLSLLFAWRQVAKMKNSSNTNLLILDEVFDSSMDSEGVDNLLKIMATLDDNINIFVVTHKPDSFEGAFNRKIIASKKGNFTSYETQLLK